MLTRKDLFPDDFNWKEYALSENLNLLFAMKNAELQEKKIDNSSILETVNPNNKIPYDIEFDDLSRLHYLVISRKVTTILEFGVGKSSIVFSDALKKNKEKWFNFTSKNLRRANLYQCHSIDNNKEWIMECNQKVPKYFFDEQILTLHFAKLTTSEFCGRICTFFDPLPNISPDLIYLDGPDQFSASGSIRGINTKHQDRMPMAADILSFEHFLQPGTLIVVDGRTANARFLQSNLQRNWAYFYSEIFDQHFFELQESPLGVFNKKQLDHCLGNSFYLRFLDN